MTEHFVVTYPDYNYELGVFISHLASHAEAWAKGHPNSDLEVMHFDCVTHRPAEADGAVVHKTFLHGAEVDTCDARLGKAWGLVGSRD